MWVSSNAYRKRCEFFLSTEYRKGHFYYFDVSHMVIYCQYGFSKLPLWTILNSPICLNTALTYRLNTHNDFPLHFTNTTFKLSPSSLTRLGFSYFSILWLFISFLFLLLTLKTVSAAILRDVLIPKVHLKERGGFPRVIIEDAWVHSLLQSNDYFVFTSCISYIRWSNFLSDWYWCKSLFQLQETERAEKMQLVNCKLII